MSYNTNLTAAELQARLDAAGNHETYTDPNHGPLIIMRDTLRAAVEGDTGGRMTVLYDDQGNPSVMHVLPRFRYEDLGFSTEMGTGTATAFDAGSGSMRSEIFIGAYQSVDVGGLACSLPHQNPWVSVNFDSAKAACTNKGAGWHLMTMHEWAAVALWCMANGFEPRGNTDHGRAHDAPHEVGTRQDGDTWPPGDSNGLGNILTGSGPAAWRHDAAVSGIADLVGNVWEWQDGLKLVDGEIFANLDNDHTLAEANWPSASRWVLNGINPGDPTLSDAAGTPAGDSQFVTWASMPLSAGYTQSQLLRRLLVEPAGISPQGGFWARDFDERVPVRGGSRNSGGSAGLAALNLNAGRGVASSGIGFRPAFVI